jgi:threonine dehydratase
VIAGQGTVAKELLEQVPNLDYLFVCLGGGGLLAGSVLAAQALARTAR